MSTARSFSMPSIVLPPGEDVVFPETVMVFQDALMVTSGNHLHASAFGTGLAEGDPDGDAFLRVDSGVG